MAHAFFRLEGCNGTCCFSVEGLQWYMQFFGQDCDYAASHRQYLQYLRVFPFTYKSKIRFSRSANNVKFKNKLYIKFKVLRV
jgi:hypothetical protein